MSSSKRAIHRDPASDATLSGHGVLILDPKREQRTPTHPLRGEAIPHPILTHGVLPGQRRVSPSWLTSRSNWLFGVCCLFVTVVSVHDAALVVANHEVIRDVEQNPIGRWLLDLQGGEVWCFVLMKLAGTAFVCAVLIRLYQRSKGMAMVSVSTLAALQFLLLCYLTLG